MNEISNKMNAKCHCHRRRGHLRRHGGGHRRRGHLRHGWDYRRRGVVVMVVVVVLIKKIIFRFFLKSISLSFTYIKRPLC